MQTLLITGGAGFIGANFVHHMLETYGDRYTLVVYDKLTYAGNLDNLRDVAKAPNYHFVRGDICDADRVTRAIEDYGVDTVINFAAETHVDRSIMDPSAFLRTNVMGTYTLLEAARRHGKLRFHQISTDEVYGHIAGDHKSVEGDPLSPRSPYAASKASADLMVNAYHITHGLPVTISRGANNIGPYQYPEKVVPLFITNALQGRPLPIYGDGRQMRDYQYVRDHCEGIDIVLHDGVIGEAYNIATGTEMENLQMVEILLDELGADRSLMQFVEDRAGHDRRYSLDVSKLAALGWEPRYSCEEAIRATVRWYVDNDWWWRKVRDEAFDSYYERQYGARKVLTEAEG
ncbi:MAG: dTDP-glucose 4,6-dehydratase [Anaerolineales bacterium]|nr:dTDP-glucose 4,6-dehydratase [Anaerolineales bacterium]MCB9126292.1 dTDP-glucose 4,6-dehydratase [Ardenticatenales bacterium]MCB9171323.1 dTDP-glucose 4,6-dehydratase [Ardenticatenales bacterium]